MDYHCTFSKTVYYDSKSKYGVFIYKTECENIPLEARDTYKYNDNLIRFCAIGYNLPQNKAASFDLEGEFINDAKYGVRLCVSSYKETKPKTIDGIKNYLFYSSIEGLNMPIISAIVNVFGVNTLEVLENSPDKLSEISEISYDKLNNIRNHYMEKKVLKELSILLEPFKLSQEIIIKIYNEFKLNSVKILENNLFLLQRFTGFAFRQIDTVHLAKGGKLSHGGRCMGIIYDVLKKKCNEKGHLFLSKSELVDKSLVAINASLRNEGKVTPNFIENCLETMVKNSDVIIYKDSIYLKRNFRLEDETAKLIADIVFYLDECIDINETLEKVKKDFDIKISKRQESAVYTAFLHNISIITGSPGTGKTTVLKAIIEVYKALFPDNEILLTAPTGRASRRMAESTGFDDSKTLHSALGLLADENTLSDDMLTADLIIVDETSMTDMWLAHQFFSRVKEGAKIILVGDIDQLPSVGAGDVFRELITSGVIPVTVLDEVFRQTKDSLIPHNAKFINDNKTSLYYGDDFVFIDCYNEADTADIISHIYFEEVFLNDTDKVQILSPFKSEGLTSADKLNAVVREEINPKNDDKLEINIGNRSFRIGDKVMQTKNRGNISNGDMGYVKEISHNENDEIIVSVVFSDDRNVDYDLDMLSELKFAYAMTVHKSMGSEYDIVIIPIISKHMILLYRNLVYTAITRAKKRVFLVGERDILFKAIHRGKTGERNTILGSRISKYLKSLIVKQDLEEKKSNEKN